MRIATEEWSVAQPDIQQLCVRHWQEIAHNKELIKLDPDWDSYARMANAGFLDVTVAREDDGKLVGYQIYFVMPHIHYRQSLTAMSDVLFLAPECRKGMLGIKLMKHAEKSLKAKGVQRILQNVKVSNDWSPILDRMGYSEFERIYSKLLAG